MGLGNTSQWETVEIVCVGSDKLYITSYGVYIYSTLNERGLVKLGAVVLYLVRCLRLIIMWFMAVTE
jgi:hypothetical protein